MSIPRWRQVAHQSLLLGLILSGVGVSAAESVQPEEAAPPATRPAGEAAQRIDGIPALNSDIAEISA